MYSRMYLQHEVKLRDIGLPKMVGSGDNTM
jgi:hypothetical protein